MINLLRPRALRNAQRRNLYLSFGLCVLCCSTILYVLKPQPAEPMHLSTAVQTENPTAVQITEQEPDPEPMPLQHNSASENPCKRIEVPQARVLAAVLHVPEPYIQVQHSGNGIQTLYPQGQLQGTDWVLQQIESDKVIWQHLAPNCRHVSAFITAKPG
ncbi:hypothetical protein [Aliidiomarina celeris]|uniref:hypothetical protein n=1 Tax=Aliidiomarina celeris TaxID=2249428 RepID=UPI000DE800D5|nr:hypothetical protein [Aliidiomarina celeris]